MVHSFHWCLQCITVNSHSCKLQQSYKILFNLIGQNNVGNIFWGSTPYGLGPQLTSEKEKGNFCVVFTYSIKQTREIRKFHVAVVQWQLRNVQKSVMHAQSCYFANLSLSCLFCHSLCRHCRDCLSSLLLWSRNFPTVVITQVSPL